MELQQKKELIFRYVDLGMSRDKAYICATCTEEEIEIIKNDKEFQYEIEVKYAMAEHDLLMQHDEALKICVTKGNASPIQWRLAKLNPKKYENKTIESGIEEKIKEFSVSIVGKGNEENCNDGNSGQSNSLDDL